MDSEDIKVLKAFKIIKKEKAEFFYENCPMFSLKLNVFDFTSLRQGQFLAND